MQNPLNNNSIVSQLNYKSFKAIYRGYRRNSRKGDIKFTER